MSAAGGARDRAWTIALALLAIPFALVGATWPLAGEGARPARHVVEMRGMAFQPAVVEAAVGDTLVWVNEDIVPHAVADAGGALASGSIPAKGSWRYVVRKAGKVAYLCPFHPTMKGTLVIR